jgi:SAM-dependent methyltransferase
MVEAAWRDARAHGLANCAFFQADVGELPREFDGGFDLVYSSLAHHHYPDPQAATREIFRALRPEGIYAIVDPGPEWFTRASAPLAKWADPGWIGFHTPHGFRALFAEAGFTCTGSLELLPGFNLSVGQKTA